MRKLYGFVMGAGLLALAQPSHALVFNLTDGTDLAALAGSNPALYAQVRGGFNTAAARWSALFTDAVQVNITINYAALGAGIIGSASSNSTLVTYTAARAALVGDVKSVDDATATANLQAAPALSLLLNRTNNSPNGAGSATPFVDNDGDANNTTIRMNQANARALGLFAAVDGTTDATITFSSNFSFDFNPVGGIDAGTMDFIGVATHEIGHALGFTSGVDILDINSSGTFFNDDQFTFVRTLDLFRYSADSAALTSLDWTADTRTKYFSIDGGSTSLATFSTGRTHGDGQQASHWKDNLGIGIMDPTADFAETLAISNLDVRALDVIGWDLPTNLGATAPEPGTVALMALGLAPLGLLARRRKA